MSGDIAIAKNLRAAGFSLEQSEALAESISNGITEGSVTKIDIAELKTELKTDIIELKTKISEIRVKTNAILAILMIVLSILLAPLLKLLF